MENIIKIIEEKVRITKITQREDLAGQLEILDKDMPKYPKSSRFFNVTDFCRPMDFFMEEKRGMKKDSALNKFFARGNRTHFILGGILKNDKDYSAYEAILDGYYKGIFLRGKIDLKIGDSLVEIKSKDEKFLPKNKEDLLEYFVSDIEQLCVYSAIDPREPIENYLVFTDKDLKEFYAYKINILDMGKIKKKIRYRIGKLKIAIKDDDISEIKTRCRYCGKYCNFYNSCEYQNLKKLEFEFLDEIKIERDEEFEQKIKKLKEESRINPNFYTPYYLICPRKQYFMQNEPTEIGSFEYDINKIYFDNLSFKFKYSKEDGTKILKATSKIKDFNISKSKWFFDKTNLNPSGRYYPYITVSSASDKSYSLSNPSKYKIAELCINLSAYGLSKGFIFQYYPNLGDKIKVFEVSFQNSENILEDIKKLIKLRDQEENFSELPKCPDYFCPNCKYYDKCHN